MAFRAPVCLNCLLFILFATTAFVPSSVSAPSGKEFVFAPMPNHPKTTAHSIGMILQGTTDEPTTVWISFPGRSFDRRITLSPGSGPLNYSFPIDLVHPNTAGPIDSTVYVASDKAITVVHYNLEPKTSDVFTVMPSETLGQEYFIATITSTNSSVVSGVVTISSLGKGVSIETHMTTTVHFLNETFKSGNVFRYTLRPFESIQLLPQFTGITGTRIITNASIAVGAGGTCTNVPEGVKHCDHIAEQLAPFPSWGKEFLLSPFVSRGSGYVFQVVAGRDRTTVLYNDTVLRLNMGEFRTIDIPSQTMEFVSSDKPITVMQYPKGRTSDGNVNSDPAMIRVPPIEQYVSEATFPVYDFDGESTHVNSIHLELTAECKYLHNISIFKDFQPLSVTWIENYTMEILDGTRMCSQWTVVSGGSYLLRSQQMTTTEGQVFYPRFRAVVYGTGLGESYLYRAAAGDRPLTCIFNPIGAGPAEEHDCPILVNPEVVSLTATQLKITWSTSPGNTGLFETCSVSLTSGEGINRVVSITTHPPATLSGLYPYTEYKFYMNCSNSLGIRARLDFPAQTTSNAVPVKPATPTIVSGGIRDYSFDINIPAYHNPNGSISCFEVIVIQLYDETTSIDSNNNAYSNKNTRDYNIARTRIGTPFSAMVFSAIPAGNVITVGSRYEIQSECNTWGEANEDHRRRRATVRAATLHATSGPLNPDSFYSCFIRVYSPSHQDGDVYFVNGPFIEPIRLKVEVPGSGTHVTLTIVCIAVTLFVISVIVIFICLRKRKRSRQQRNVSSPTTSASFTTTHHKCKDLLPANSPTSTGNRQVEDVNTEYEPVDKTSNPIYQNVNHDLVEGEYELVNSEVTLGFFRIIE